MSNLKAKKIISVGVITVHTATDHQIFSIFLSIINGIGALFLKIVLLLLKETENQAYLLGYVLLDNCIGRLYTNFQFSATLSKKVLIFLPNFKKCVFYLLCFREDLLDFNK